MAEYVVEARDSTALRCALDAVLPDAASVTVYMCWHSGVGHNYPPKALAAAQRLRQRHAQGSGSRCSDEYTSLTFAPSSEDGRDLVEVVPFCDLVYATGPNDELLAEASGEGATASVWLTAAQHTEVLERCPGTVLVPAGGEASSQPQGVARLAGRLLKRSSRLAGRLLKRS